MSKFKIPFKIKNGRLIYKASKDGAYDELHGKEHRKKDTEDLNKKAKFNTMKEKTIKNILDKMKNEDCGLNESNDPLKKDFKINEEEFLVEWTTDNKKGAEVFLDEETGEHYFIEFNGETLEETRIIIRVNAKGKRRRLLRCPKGRIVKTVNGRKVCATQGGKERLTKKLAMRKMVRSKKAKGKGYVKRSNIKRARAMKKRKGMGL